MDFITDLLKLKGYINIVVVINRLSKGVVANKLDNLKVKIIVK